MNKPPVTRVLLLEDDDADARLIELMLNEARGHFELSRVSTLTDALALIGREEFDVALVDLRVSDSAGVTTCESVREAAPRLAMVVVSGLENEPQAVQVVSLGAQDYLFKDELDRGMLSRSIRYAMERKRIEQELRDSEERYALAVRGANDGLWDWDLDSGRIYFSDRWKAMVGASIHFEGVPNEWFDRIHPDDCELFGAAIKAHLDDQTPQLMFEFRMERADGMFRWMLCRGLAVRGDDGRATRLAGSMSDITKRKHAEERLVHEALHDALTGLPNRVLFLDRLGQSLRRARRNQAFDYAVLFLDLDGFKLVNDSLGHVVGDQLLIEISRRVRGCIRPSDTVARLGGDEFAVLLDGELKDGDAERAAERIHAELRKPVMIKEQEVFTSCSIGITRSSEEYRRPEELLRDADSAMYLAKEQGRARYEVSDPAIHLAALERLELETDLHGATERGELQLNFQPIVALASGETVGFEALLRWQCPTRGTVAPKEFIPIAEDTGLIVPIGEWVLENACRQMKAWQTSIPSMAQCCISVNLSARQFMEADLCYRIADILAATGLDPRYLVLEITENVLMKNADSMARTLRAIRKLGVRIDIDDFGTGCSSLGCLHQFPIDRLKIDLSFVAGMSTVKGDMEIVRAIVSLAHSLEIAVVAEGIETPEQLRRLRLLSCEYGQGFLFSRPVECHDEGLMAFEMAG